MLFISLERYHYSASAVLLYKNPCRNDRDQKFKILDIIFSDVFLLNLPLVCFWR